eukprot:40166-Eustigmatos_ZCMA.PRE.1
MSLLVTARQGCYTSGKPVLKGGSDYVVMSYPLHGLTCLLSSCILQESKIVAYYCRQYAMEQGIAMRDSANSKEVRVQPHACTRAMLSCRYYS